MSSGIVANNGILATSGYAPACIAFTVEANSLHIIVLPSRKVLEAHEDETLLDALCRGEEGISYSCKDGRCGMCRCYVRSLRVLDGAVPNISIPDAQECLACQTIPRPGMLVELPDSGEPVVLQAFNFRGTVASIEKLAVDSLRIRMTIDRSVRYLGGQHFEMRLPVGDRVYSTVPSTVPGQIAFDVQIHPYGVVSHYIRNSMKQGDVVRLRGPLGSGYLRRHQVRPHLVLMSSGTGMGAMLSMLKDVADQQLSAQVHAYAAFAFAEQVYGREEFAAWTSAVPNLGRSQIIVGSGRLQRGDQRGLLVDDLSEKLPATGSATFHVFGTASAVDATVRTLAALGHSPRQMHAVRYHTLDATSPAG